MSKFKFWPIQNPLLKQIVILEKIYFRLWRKNGFEHKIFNDDGKKMILTEDMENFESCQNVDGDLMICQDLKKLDSLQIDGCKVDIENKVQNGPKSTMILGTNAKQPSETESEKFNFSTTGKCGNLRIILSYQDFM